jgi:hypothetical protein
LTRPPATTFKGKKPDSPHSVVKPKDHLIQTSMDKGPKIWPIWSKISSVAEVVKKQWIRLVQQLNHARESQLPDLCLGREMAGTLFADTEA